MTTTQNNGAALEQIQPSAPVARPTEIGQATSIEQARALAEVQAAAYLARQFPRDTQRALADMLDACGQQALAERSAFSFPRAGQKVTGASIHLARELARCWGNIQYGLVELSRDDISGSSQMIAYAWDLQTNARSSSTFIVPHTRDTKSGAVKLTETRDIYENNANQGARRVREAIFAVIPTWFVEQAKTKCRETLEHGGGEPLPVRIDKMITAFKALHVTVDQLEHRVSTPRVEWTVQEVATLGIVFTSIRNGETRKEDEFPPLTAPVTGQEVAAQAARPRKTTAPKPADTTALVDEIFALAIDLGINEADVADDFAQRNGGQEMASASADLLAGFRDALAAEKAGAR